MFNFGTLEETAVYKDLFAMGEAKGEAKGEVKGEAKGEWKTLKNMVNYLEGLFQQGVLPEDQYRTEVGRLNSRLTELEQKLDRFKPL